MAWTFRPEIVMLLETVMSISVRVEPFIVRPTVFAVPKVPSNVTSLVTTETLPDAISNRPLL